MDKSDRESWTLTCPFCAEAELRGFGRNSLRCDECGDVLGGALLETLGRIVSLPDASEITPASAAIPRCDDSPTECTDVRPADPRSPPSQPRCPGSRQSTPRRTGRAGSTAATESRINSRTTAAWPSGTAPPTVSTTTEATAPDTKPG